MPLLQELSWFLGSPNYRHGGPSGAYQKEKKDLCNLFRRFLHFLRRPLVSGGATDLHPLPNKQQPKVHKPKLMKTKQDLNHVKFALIVSVLSLPLMSHSGQHPHYKLIDLGTFGGPSSGLQHLEEIVNNRGTVIGIADTAVPDPFARVCFGPSCYVQHAFQWQGGVLSDLGTLPGGHGSPALRELVVCRAGLVLCSARTAAHDRLEHVGSANGHLGFAYCIDERSHSNH